MFAVRRSFFHLPCFNNPFLTCCLLLLVFGNVSPMSLERHRREFQQQNDKQLELSDLMLPEAESELLRSDMELVPAIDGNSDMYLLVPASAAASPEQSLQSLTELSDNQKSDNIENNSDMLMQESEDAAVTHILELPEHVIETNIHNELVGKNELSEENDLANESLQPVPERLVNTIAEAAQEIKNEIETELDRHEENHKIEEFLKAEIANTETEQQPEKHEQEMIGVVLEEINKTPAAAIENENLPEETQIDIQSEDFKDQFNDSSQKKSDKDPSPDSENTEFSESSSLMNTEDLENTADIKIENEEANLKNGETNENYNHIASLELKVESEEQPSNDETKEVTDLQADNANNLESQATIQNVEENNALEGTQIEDKVMDQLDDKIKSSIESNSAVRDETEIKLDEMQSEESDETSVVSGDEIPAEEIAAEHSQSNEETLDEMEQTQDEVQAPSKESSAVLDVVQSLEPEADSLLEPVSYAETENAEEIDNQEEDINEAVMDFETNQNELSDLSANESSQVKETQLNSESPIEENLSLVEQLTQDEESASSQLSDVKDNGQADILQSLNEEQNFQDISKNEAEAEILEAQNAVNQVLPIQDEGEKAEVIQPSEELELAEESEYIKDTEKDDNLKSNEAAETDQDIQSNEQLQNLQEDKTIEDDHLMENNKNSEEVEETSLAPTAEEEEVTNSPTFEETHHDDETAAVDMLQSFEIDQALELHQAADETQTIADVITSDEANTEDDATKSIEEFQTVEETETEKSHEVAQSIEEIQSNESVEHLAAEAAMNTEELQYDTENTGVEEIVKSEVPAIEMETLLEESTQEEDHTQSLLSQEEIQQTESSEFSIEEENSELAAKPAEISNDEINPLESFKTEEEAENAGHLDVLADEITVQSTENNQSVLEQHESIESQEPLNGIDNIPDSDKNESDPESEITTMLTIVEQVATSDELTQQQQQEQQKHDEHQQPAEHEAEELIAVEETISSTTLKPLNVLDSVLNYVNASFMSPTSNDNGGDSEQEIKKEPEVFSSKLRRYDGAQVWRIVVQNDRERKFADELQTKYDGQLWKEVKQEVDYLLKPQVLAEAEQYVRAANLSRIVLIDNLQKVIEVENPPAQEIEELQNRKGSRLTWQAYHRLEDIHSYFDFMAKTYPDICSIEVIGYSLEKRPLKILKISNGNANNPGFWIDGGMHAREWIGPSVVTFIANQIIEGWDDLPAYMRNINWYIHAVANPDGYEYSHTTDRLWRKNMRSHGRACPGVDLNRNFGYKWGGKGTSANPCSQTYRGSKAFSEPETFYISKFISNFPRDTFKAYLSFHSYGQYILYPWGYDYHITKDMADLDLVGRQAGTIITKSTGAKFTVGSSATTLYPAAGGSDDWAKGIAGIKYSYTIEMGDTGRYGFVLPAEHIEANGKNGFTVVETVAKAITMGKNARRRKLKAHKTH